MAYDSASGVATAAQIAAGNVTLISGRPAEGFTSRRLTIQNLTNQTQSFLVRQFGQTAMSPDIIAFTLTSLQYAVIGRGVAVFTGYTRTSGNEALLDAPCAQLTVFVLQNAAATGGNVTAELEQVS